MIGTMTAGIVIGILLTIATLATIFFAVVYTKYKTPPLERGKVVEVSEEDFWNTDDTTNTTDVSSLVSLEKETPIIPIQKNMDANLQDNLGQILERVGNPHGKLHGNPQADRAKKKVIAQRRKKNKIARKSRKNNRKK